MFIGSETGGGGGGGGGTVTKCPIETILSGTYGLLPPLVQGICQFETYLCSFFSNEGSFSHLFFSIVWIVGLTH